MPVVVDSSGRQRDLHLTLCLTHDCNLRCSYCYGGSKSRRHMSMATARRALAWARARVGQRLHLVFFGGEPLLRWPVLTRVTELARGQCVAAGVELRPTVTTNGTLLSPARVEWLRQERFVVAISCDGTRRAQDRNRRTRRGRSSHRRAVAGLERALGAGLAVRVVLVVDPSNVAELADSVAELRARGAVDFVLNPNWAADWSGQDVLAAWTTAYEAIVGDYVQAYRAGRPFWISFVDPKIAAHIKGGYLAEELCDLGRRHLVVAASGNLYPCDRLVGEDRDARFVIGRLPRGIDETHQSSLVRTVCRLPSDCGACAVAARCRNRCACANLAMTGDVGRPAELLCFHEQLSIRLADEAAEQLFAERNEQFIVRHYGTAID